mmetsp:Transcript_6560/g.13214  ORF Transcript_6560/g.13214 Transcript_6560/m.13214 type:complete len:85 (+) Transcript_6560:1056-1310(+)
MAAQVRQVYSRYKVENVKNHERIYSDPYEARGRRDCSHRLLLAPISRMGSITAPALTRTSGTMFRRKLDDVCHSFPSGMASEAS